MRQFVKFAPGPANGDPVRYYMDKRETPMFYLFSIASEDMATVTWLVVTADNDAEAITTATAYDDCAELSDIFDDAEDLEGLEYKLIAA